MTRRSPWVVVPVTVAVVLVLYVWLAWGSQAASNVGWFVLFVVGLIGPFYAAAELWGTSEDSPSRSPMVSIPRPRGPRVQLAEGSGAPRSFRRSLLAFLAFPLVAAFLMGWLGQGGMLVTISVVLVFFGIMVLTPLAFLATAAARGGRVEFEEVARSLWTLVLAGAVYGLALPIGWVFESIAMDRAKAWVETAATEVRAEEMRTGHLPDSMATILQRLGPAPSMLHPPGFGYSLGAVEGEFEFRVVEPGGYIDDNWWVYDGRTGVWRWEPG